MMFIPYICCGDPSLEFTAKLIRALAPHSDVIEFGIPFSDPMADGPSIQAAAQRSLANGTNPDKIFDMAKELRKTIKTPFVFMTYYNIVHAYGTEKFMMKAKECGIQGAIIPDVPYGEDDELESAATKSGVRIVRLIALNTPEKRAKEILASPGIFTYLVSLAGTTGERKSAADESVAFVKRIRALAGPKSTLCVGFGVSNPDTAKQFISAGADGVIVGSKLINMYSGKIKANGKEVENEKAVLDEMAQFAASIKNAVK